MVELDEVSRSNAVVLDLSCKFMCLDGFAIFAMTLDKFLCKEPTKPRNVLHQLVLGVVGSCR